MNHFGLTRKKMEMKISKVKAGYWYQGCIDTHYIDEENQSLHIRVLLDINNPQKDEFFDGIPDVGADYDIAIPIIFERNSYFMEFADMLGILDVISDLEWESFDTDSFECFLDETDVEVLFCEETDGRLRVQHIR